MKKYNLNVYFLNLLLSYILICLSCQFDLKDEFKQEDDSYFDYTLEPGKVQMKYLNDANEEPFIYKDKNDVLVNFYSLSCNIELDSYYSNQNIKLLNLTENFISMIVIKQYKYQTINIFIKEKVNLINGINKYKNIKNCPLIINTIDVKDVNYLSLSLEKNEPTILYFDEIFKIFNLDFQIKKDGFIALSFSFNNVSEFNINISDILNTTISNSTTIYLDNDTLNTIEENINIRIEHIGSNPCLLTFQIIEPESICILQRDFINKGFIDRKNTSLYYFMEVFEEEGEIMLNNKRQSGKLYGKIKKKVGINPYNINEYIQNEEDNQLEFNEHTQKLSFNSRHTKNCTKGCYLFLTYYNKIENHTEPIIGYEYTLLARIWDVEDFGPQIINIPFNEYIFGTFEENSFISHYYSVFIPQGIKQIIMQIDSNYVEGFFGEGKKKLITFRKELTSLNLTDDKMIIKFSEDKLKSFIGKEITFAFRSRNFFENTFSFYDFRLLILKENDTNLIYPLDTNIENICLPEKDNNTDSYYYCYALLCNNYKEFNIKFSVSTSNLNDNYKIYVYKNYTEEGKNYNKFFISDDDYTENLTSILFKFEFEDNNPKIILSTFSNDKYLNYPQIYSPQIHGLNNTSKVFNYKLNKGNCLLIFKLIYGRGNIIFDKYPSIEINENYKEKLITISFSEVKNIEFKSKENFIFYTKLECESQQFEKKEINYDESMNEILLNTNFPLFYYIKYNNQSNIDINFRIINIKDRNATTDITIDGYMLSQTNLKRVLEGDFIQLKESITGQYDKIFKNGLLQINETIINKYFNITEEDNENDKMKYVLIIIDGDHLNSYSLSIEIIAMSKNNGSYLVPVNQYIMGYRTFNSINYLIKSKVTDKNTDIIIEFSPNYKEIKLNFDNPNIANGIQKYRIKNNNTDIFLKINKPDGIYDGNYLFRYYFLKNNEEFKYKFDQYSYTTKINNNDNNNTDICFEFNKVEINHNEILVNYKIFNINEDEINNQKNSNIRLKIYGFLYKRNNANNKYNEILNTSAFISSEFSYENNTEINYTDNNTFEICFNNMDKNVYIYDMQIKINIIFNKYFSKEDSLAYTLPIDLTEVLKKKKDMPAHAIYTAIIIIFIIIVLLIVLLHFFKLKKRNNNLENQVLSIKLTSINNEQLNNEISEKKIDPEYDNTFI